MDQLKANILIRIDIIVLEDINIIITKSITSIGSCKVNILIKVKSINKTVRYPIYIRYTTIILPYSKA